MQGKDNFMCIFSEHIQNRLFQAEGEATMKLYLNKNFMNWHTTSSDDIDVVSWPVWLGFLLIKSCPFHPFSAFIAGPVRHPIMVPFIWDNSNVPVYLEFNEMKRHP